jgi:hypothetical protein
MEGVPILVKQTEHVADKQDHEQWHEKPASGTGSTPPTVSVPPAKSAKQQDQEKDK